MKSERGRKIAGVHVKKRLFIEGLGLLRALATAPVSRDQAASELGIPRREWYRWLQVFRELGIPLAGSVRRNRAGVREKAYRLWREDWARLIRR